VADGVVSAAAPGVPRIRRRAQVEPARFVSPSEPQDSLRYRQPNANGQARGASATITGSMLNTGTKSNRRLKPSGWQGHGRKYNEARAHLIANLLGGTGRDMANLVTMTQNGANTPQMRDFEMDVARRVRQGEVVEYSATPLYSPGTLPPSAILMTAYGSRGGPSAKVIQNPTAFRR
jgi:hypothetical protein